MTWPSMRKWRDQTSVSSSPSIEITSRYLLAAIPPHWEDTQPWHTMLAHPEVKHRHRALSIERRSQIGGAFSSERQVTIYQKKD